MEIAMISLTELPLCQHVRSKQNVGRVAVGCPRAQEIRLAANDEADDGQHSLQGLRGVLCARQEPDLPDVGIKL